jgi:hypothetical protein
MMRRRLIMVAGVALALAVGAAPASAARPASSFTGNWTSTDTDGSSQTLTVSSGGSPSVVYQDFYASGCDNEGAPATHWTAAGKGFVDGDDLIVSFHKSGCGRFIQGGYLDVYSYESGSDTLVDTFGITWTRA